MYSPSQPNDYRNFRLEQERHRREKRRREQQQDALTNNTDANNTISNSSLSAGMSFVSQDSLSLLESSSGSSWLVGGGLLLFDADTLVKQRLEHSAALGVTAAKQQLQEEQEVHHKEHVQQGKDMKSKLGKLLGKLSEAGGGSGAGSENVAHLVFAPSTMAAGGHVITKSTDVGTVDTKKTIRGKPSSTVVFTVTPTTGLASFSLQDQEDMLGPWVCQALQQECGKCGVVRSTKRVSTAASLGDESTATTSTTHPDEAIRLFVRFDTAASAFKAAERVEGKVLAQFCSGVGLSLPPNDARFDKAILRATFYPTAQYDTNVFDVPVGAPAPVSVAAIVPSSAPSHAFEAPPLFGHM